MSWAPPPPLAGGVALTLGRGQSARELVHCRVPWRQHLGGGALQGLALWPMPCAAFVQDSTDHPRLFTPLVQ